VGFKPTIKYSAMKAIYKISVDLHIFVKCTFGINYLRAVFDKLLYMYVHVHNSDVHCKLNYRSKSKKIFFFLFQVWAQLFTLSNGRKQKIFSCQGSNQDSLTMTNKQFMPHRIHLTQSKLFIRFFLFSVN
jgi:hypothetical protein